MSSDYKRWQVSLSLSSLPFTPLGNRGAWVTAPKDSYMVDLPSLMSLCSWCAVSQTVPSASFWKNLTTSFESVLAKVPDSVSYWIDLLFLARSSYQVLSLLILALEGEVCENDIRFLLLCSHQYLKLQLISELIPHWLGSSWPLPVWGESTSPRKKGCIHLLTVEGKEAKSLVQTPLPCCFPHSEAPVNTTCRSQLLLDLY